MSGLRLCDHCGFIDDPGEGQPCPCTAYASGQPVHRKRPAGRGSAYSRALGALRNRHRDEFEQLLQRERDNETAAGPAA